MLNIFFNQILNNTVYVALLMNGLNLISQMENNYVSINGYEYDLADEKFGVFQGSVLGLLLFLIYINYLNQALKSSKVHHYADDTNLIHFSKSVYRLNKYVNLDFQNLTYWLKLASAIFLTNFYFFTK